MAAPDLQTLSPLELATTGLALYGAGWRTRLAAALEVSEDELALVERGLMAPPREWRAKLVMLAQDLALRAMEAANALLWCEEVAESEPEARPA